jgi:hypothetical protein
MACDATMSAKIAMINPAGRSRGGADAKKEVIYALGLMLMYAAWQMYASKR